MVIMVGEMAAVLRVEVAMVEEEEEEAVAVEDASKKHFRCGLHLARTFAR